MYVIPYPVIDPVLLELGPLVIRWYALAYIAGLIIGWRYIVKLLRNAKLWRNTNGDTVAPPVSETEIDDLLLWVTAGVILGGRIGYVLFYKPVFYFTNPQKIIAVWEGGMSFHGGMLGVVIAVLLFAWRRKRPALAFGDVIAPAVPIGLFFGRIANFINGELFGRVTDVPWAMVFPNGEAEARHPSQIYEALLEGALLFFLIRVITHHSPAFRRPGEVTGVFLLGYGTMRIISEFFREPDEHLQFLFGHMTMGMLLSVPMIVVGIALIWRARLRGTASART